MFKLFVKDLKPLNDKDIDIIPEISYDFINKKCILRHKVVTFCIPFILIKVLYKTIIKSEEMNIDS